MANTPWKGVDVPREMKPGETASALAASFPSPLMAGAWKAGLRSGDRTASCMRTVAVQHTGGSGAWLVGNVDPDLAAQSYPEPNVKRTVAVSMWQLAPGNMPTVRVVSVASGMTETFHLINGKWLAYGVLGWLGVDFRFFNGTDNDTRSVLIDLPPSDEADGYEPTSAGASWDVLSFGYATLADGNLEALKKWSEDTTCTATISHYGGARVVHASVCETPSTHVVPHDAEDVSLHGWAPQQQPDARPQIEMRDGVTFEEHRFGVHRGFRVASKQNRKLGPVIASWSSYAEGEAEVADTTQDPVTVTSTSWVGVSIGSGETEWSNNLPGHDIAGHYAGPAPENLPTRVSGVTMIPVRIRVRARFAADGGDFGYMKFQTTPRSWIILPIPQVSTAAWYDTTGWLESTDAVDDVVPVLADFAKVESGSMQITDWCVHWGEFAVPE